MAGECGCRRRQTHLTSSFFYFLIQITFDLLSVMAPPTGHLHVRCSEGSFHSKTHNYLRLQWMYTETAEKVNTYFTMYVENTFIADWDVSFILKLTKPEVLAEVEPSDFLLCLIEAVS